MNKGHEEHTELVCSKEQHTFQDHGSWERLIEWSLCQVIPRSVLDRAGQFWTERCQKTGAIW